MAVSIAIAAIVVLVFLVFRILRKGKLGFWNAVHRNPEQALEFFRENSEWQVVDASVERDGDRTPPSNEWDGPFRLGIADPRYSSLLVYGRIGKYEASQEAFIRSLKGDSASQNLRKASHTATTPDIIAQAILQNLLKPDGFSEIVDSFIERESQVQFAPEDRGILAFAVQCYSCASAIVALRNKYGERAEPLVREFHKRIVELHKSTRDDQKPGELALSVVKSYYANWTTTTAQAAGPLDFAFRSSEVFLEPFVERLSCARELATSVRLTLVLNSVMVASARIVNEVLALAKREYGYEPSFADASSE